MATQPHVQRADLKQKVKKVLLLPEAVSGILASAFSELFRSRSRSPHPLDVARYRTGLKLAAEVTAQDVVCLQARAWRRGTSFYVQF
jgi:hypothetical protein